MGITCRAQSQPQPPVASSGSTEQSQVPRVPGISALLRGANGGVTFASVHDAATGWATVLEPAFGYTFNDIFAFDITVPIYFYRLAESQKTNPKPNALLVPRRGELGDVVMGFHGQFLPPGLQYEATISATAPTGDETNGLSTGRPTFDLSNLFQHSFKHVTPEIELGVGDSTSLANRLVTKDYTSLGPLAHFQLGAAFDLPHGISFETNAYELLPIGDQKIYQSVTRNKTTTLVVTGHNVTEDNGFTNSLDIPLDRHTTLSGYYSRSLRQHDDIVSLALTYVFRGAKPATDDSTPKSNQKAADPPQPPAF